MGNIASYARLDTVPTNGKCKLYQHVKNVSVAVAQRVPKGTSLVVLIDPVTKQLVTYLPFNAQGDVKLGNWQHHAEQLARKSSSKKQQSHRRAPQIPSCMARVEFDPELGFVAGMMTAAQRVPDGSGAWFEPCIPHVGQWDIDVNPGAKKDDSKNTAPLTAPFRTYENTADIVSSLDPCQGDAQGKLENRHIHVVAEQLLTFMVQDSSDSTTTSRQQDIHSLTRQREEAMIDELIGIYSSDHRANDTVSTPNGHEELGVETSEKHSTSKMVVTMPYYSHDRLSCLVLHAPADSRVDDEGKERVLSAIKAAIDSCDSNLDDIDIAHNMSLSNYDWANLDEQREGFLAKWHAQYGNWNIPFWSMDLHELVSLLFAPIIEFGLHLHLNSTTNQYREALRMTTVVNFAKYAISGYNETAYYHNAFHGCQVLHATFMIMRGTYLPGPDEQGKVAPPQPMVSLVSKIDSIALFFGALTHDIDHPMLTNLFLKNSRHPIADRYNDLSVLENYHASFVFDKILSRPEANIQELWSPAQRSSFRKTFIKVVLSTDMEFHGQGVMNARDRIACHLKGEKPFNYYNESDRMFVLEGVMRMADASNPTLPYPSVAMWGTAISEEFVLQTLAEYDIGIASTHFMRLVARKDKARMLYDFCSLVVLPLYTEFSNMMPIVKERTEWLHGSIRMWSKVHQYYASIEEIEKELTECTDAEMRAALLKNRSGKINHWVNLGPWTKEFGEWGGDCMINSCDSKHCLNRKAKDDAIGLWARHSILHANKLVPVPVIDREIEGMRSIISMEINEPSSTQVPYMPVAYLDCTEEVRRKRNSYDMTKVYPYLRKMLAAKGKEPPPSMESPSSSKTSSMRLSDNENYQPKHNLIHTADAVGTVECRCTGDYYLRENDDSPPDVIVDMRSIFSFARLFRDSGHLTALPVTCRTTDPESWPAPINFEDYKYIKRPQPSEMCSAFQERKMKSCSYKMNGRPIKLRL